MRELRRWIYLIVGILVIVVATLFVCLHIAEHQPDQAQEVTVQK
jgi:hypothetical protein